MTLCGGGRSLSSRGRALGRTSHAHGFAAQSRHLGAEGRGSREGARLGLGLGGGGDTWGGWARKTPPGGRGGSFALSLPPCPGRHGVQARCPGPSRDVSAQRAGTPAHAALCVTAPAPLAGKVKSSPLPPKHTLRSQTQGTEGGAGPGPRAAWLRAGLRVAAPLACGGLPLSPAGGCPPGPWVAAPLACSASLLLSRGAEFPASEPCGP